MSNNNGNDGGAAMGLALVFAAMYFIGLVAYALACFLAVICTVLSFLAWDKPLRLFGHQIFSPDEARWYMYSAVGGSILIPAFAFFCAVLFNLNIKTSLWGHIILGSYSFSPWIVLSFMSQEAIDSLGAESYPTVIDHAPPMAPSLPPAPKSFDYASWVDETPGGTPKG